MSVNYKERVRKARKLMESEGLDCLHILGGTNQTYFAGWSSYPWGWPYWLSPLVIPLDGDASFILTEMHKEIYLSGKEKRWVTDVRTYFDGDREKAFNQLKTLLKEKKLDKATIGVENSMAFGDYEVLREVAPEAKIKNAQTLIDTLRQVKDEQEIQWLRKSAEIGDIYFKAAADYYREGRTIGEVQLEIAKAVFNAGPDGVSIPTESKSRIIRKGDVFNLEAMYPVHGYSVDVDRDIFIGPPTDRERKMWQVIVDTYRKIEAMVRPGVTCHELDTTCRTLMREGLKGIIPNYTQPWKVGHGVGLGPGHEAPRLEQGNMTKLVPGMVFSIDPGLFIEKYDPIFGYSVPLHVERAMLVTKRACEALEKYTIELVQV
jgi:Xaa-Pro aminopeptidase